MKLFKKVVPKQVLGLFFKKKHKELLIGSPLFDPEYYINAWRAEYKTEDGPVSHGDAVNHYLKNATTSNVNPSVNFNSAWYLQRYSDVKASGMNPLVHYLLFGQFENRRPKPSLLEQIDLLPLNKKRLDIVFFSSRTDGFGERLKALLNAMVLADYLQCDFRFSWPLSSYLGDTHSIARPEDTFAQPFLSSYHEANVPDNFVELDSVQDITSLTPSEPTTIQVSQINILKQYPSLTEKISPDVFARAFKTIGFSDSLMKAINMANRVHLHSPCVSLHLRSGDIVYGRYRFDDRYTNKVISYAQADFMISECKKNGINVVLLGQSNHVCRALADKYDCLFFGDDPKIGALSTIQQAIFDMVLMSRTDKIYAGNSGFSQLAELIGKADIRSPEQDFEHKAMSQHIMDVLNNERSIHFDRYQNAFSCWHLVFYFKDVIGLGDSIRFLQLALNYTGDCLFYNVVLAVLYFEAGDSEQASTQIEEVLKNKQLGTDRVGDYQYLAKHRYSDGKSPLHKYRGNLLQMSKAGIEGAGQLFREIR